MEQKASKFIALLVKKFNNADLSNAELKEAYQTVVTTLKVGRLKTELIKNSIRYQQDFERRCQKSKNIQLKSNQNAEILLLKTSCQKVQRKLDVLTPTSPQYIQLTEQLHKIDSKNELLYPELGALCSLLCTREDVSSLTNTMVIIFSVLQPAVESSLDANDRSRCCQLKSELQNLLGFLHIKLCILDSKLNKIQTDIGSVKYDDIMASLLSLYLDLSLYIVRQDGTESDPGVDKMNICGFVCQLVPVPSLIDVLLQISKFTSSDLDIILPIARKCLLVTPTRLDYKLYTKFMVCAHSVVTVLGEEGTGGITQVAESLAAPKGYVDWLRELNPEIVEGLPEDRKFKGRTISQFIMREGNPELMEALLDCVTEELPDPVSLKQENVKQGSQADGDNEPADKPTDEPLFFVDTTGQNTKEKSDAKSFSQWNGNKTSNHDDVEVIEVDLSAFPRQPDMEKVEMGDNSSAEESNSSEDESIDEDPQLTVSPSKMPRVENELTTSITKTIQPRLRRYNLRKKMAS